MNKTATERVLVMCATLFFSACTALPGAAQQSSGPKAEKGYQVSVFTQGIAGKYTEPDSITVLDGNVYIGYGDGILPDGSDGKTSNIIEYTKDGQMGHVYTVVGHNDGLKAVRGTHLLVAIQNEDANPNVVVIDTSSGTQTVYNFAAKPAHGGGYDDLVIRKGKVYFSASNPANNPNNEQAIVQATLSGNLITVTPVLEGNAAATNVVTGSSVTLNLQDPDSMTLDPQGDLFMTSQADAELIVVRKPGTQDQSVLQIPLTSPYGSAQADDTVFTPSGDGFILVADTPANTVYAIRKTEFAPGVAYTAAVAGTQGFVGRLDLDFGLLTPVVTGMQSPHGMAFVKTKDDGSAYDQAEDACQRLFSQQ
jgi:hypothetical protein